MTPNKRIQELSDAARKLHYPNLPEYAFPKVKYQTSTSNGITKYIVDFIRLQGWQAERINSTGSVRMETVNHASGITGKKVSFNRSTGQKGTADISATINGKSVKIEVKNKATKDRMSADQRRYRDMIQATGGVYYIARTIPDFLSWYDENFKQNPNHEAVKFTYFRTKGINENSLFLYICDLEINEKLKIGKGEQIQIAAESAQFFLNKSPDHNFK